MSFTLVAPCELLETVQKSRFRVHATPVSTSEQAMAFIQTVSDPSASHNCWAWKIGNQYRFSDDGEPGGTAGRPILAAIEGQGFDEVAVVVTRWFGGIKLGTGGLARAYGGSTARCLQTAERRELVMLLRGRCHCRFAELNLLKARLADCQVQVEGERFDAEGAILELSFTPERRETLEQLLASISRGHSQLQLSDS